MKYQYRVCKLKQEVRNPDLIVKGSKAVILSEPDSDNRVRISKFGDFKTTGFCGVDNLIIGER